MVKKAFGSFYLTGTWSRYWVTNNSQSSFSFGYSSNFSWASYSIGVQRTYNDGERTDAIYLTLNAFLSIDSLVANRAAAASIL